MTGGAGFIGSNFVSSWIVHTGGTVVNLDKLTYAGNLRNLVKEIQSFVHSHFQNIVDILPLVPDVQGVFVEPLPFADVTGNIHVR